MNESVFYNPNLQLTDNRESISDTNRSMKVRKSLGVAAIGTTLFVTSCAVGAQLGKDSDNSVDLFNNQVVYGSQCSDKVIEKVQERSWPYELSFYNSDLSSKIISNGGASTEDARQLIAIADNADTIQGYTESGPSGRSPFDPAPVIPENVTATDAQIKYTQESINSLLANTEDDKFGTATPLVLVPIGSEDNFISGDGKLGDDVNVCVAWSSPVDNEQFVKY